MSEQLLDRSRVLEALGRLAERLSREGVRADIYVFGGAAMAIAFQDRKPTADVDAVFEPQEAVITAARRVADELGLPRSWLNDQAASFVPGRQDLEAAALSEGGSVRIMRASPRHLLAMKVLSGRAERDLEDIALLMAELKLSSREEVLGTVQTVVPEAQLTERARLTLDALFPDVGRPVGL